MTKDAWIYVDENDGSMKSGWYYLNRNGKVEKNDWKTIGKGKYCFDSDGRMRTGWHYENGDIYYLGNGFGRLYQKWLVFLESDGKNVRQREVFQRIFPGSLKMEDGIISSPTAKPEKVKMVLQRKQPLMERNIILTKMVLCLPAGSV